jgi:protein-tyrosine-phosphatase
VAHVSGHVENAFDDQTSVGKNFGRTRFRGVKPATFTITWVVLPEEEDHFWQSVAPLFRQKGKKANSPPMACINPQINRWGIDTVSVVSAGLHAVPGNPAHPRALLTATARSVDLSRHLASPIVPDRVAASDVIFVMDIPQVVAMRKRFPDARRKTCLLTCLAPEVPLEIVDPVNGDEAAFQVCYDHIARAVRPIVHTLSTTATRRYEAP